jgi:hypothetical protein
VVCSLSLADGVAVDLIIDGLHRAVEPRAAPRVLDLLRGNDCASCAPNVHWLQSMAPWAARGREAGLASWTRLAQAVMSLGLQ